MTLGRMLSYNSIEDTAPLILYFKNFGQTPAKRVRFRAKVLIGPEWNAPFDIDVSAEPMIHMGHMPPNIIKDRDGFTVIGLKEAHANILFACSSVFVSGLIEYEDGFGKSYKNAFRLASSSTDYTNCRFSVTPRGNEAE